MTKFYPISLLQPEGDYVGNLGAFSGELQADRIRRVQS